MCSNNSAVASVLQARLAQLLPLSQRLPELEAQLAASGGAVAEARSRCQDVELEAAALARRLEGVEANGRGLREQVSTGPPAASRAARQVGHQGGSFGGVERCFRRGSQRFPWRGEQVPLAG